jgi:5-methyltetrahydrofolate--homocysteine methyltransferase
VETRVSSVRKEVLIGHGRPTVLIGERLNPTGKKKLTAALQAGDLDFLQKEAIAQVQAGADILDINVGMPGLDEVALLPRAVESVTNVVDVPLCLDSRNPRALEASLKVYHGKPIINSVNGEERSMERVLPLVKEYRTAVIALTMDSEGIPKEADRRVAIALSIMERADTLGISREDIIIDPLAMTVGADPGAGLVTIETIRRIKAEFGVNMTLGASNISFGLPDRNLLNSAFLAIAIAAGVTCPIVDAAKARAAILAADLILGRDQHARRYITAYRQRRQA